jgi:hypothetical protein
MTRKTMVAVACILGAIAFGGAASAEQVITTTVTEAAVDKACGEKIEGGCNDKLCATGCRKIENGKSVDYGCVFPNKTGKTKATCTKSVQ